MAFHDLTTKMKPHPNLKSLLGLSLKFIPTPRNNVPWHEYATNTFPKFERAMRLKAFFAHRKHGRAFEGWEDYQDPTADMTKEEAWGYNRRMYIPTLWEPPDWAKFPPPLLYRMDKFRQEVQSIVKPKKCKTNLLPHQQRALRLLQSQKDFLVVQCDKNLGPAIIERDEYIKIAIRDHLQDHQTYRRLNQDTANRERQKIKRLFDKWRETFKKVLDKNEKRYLDYHRQNYDDEFSTFYVTMKVHKTPLKTRPIISTSGTLLRALGVWCDSKLQIAAQQCQCYFKDTFELKKQLEDVTLPPGALLFTADATSMYTNIPTNKALRRIKEYLEEKKYDGIPVKALMFGLKIVMKWNVFKFGDLTYKQRTGTAMGTPPAPPWAIVYYATFEETFLPDFQQELHLYKRFIDDVWGIFIVNPRNPGRFQEFITAMNNPESELEWIVQPLSNHVIFMDIEIMIRENKLATTLYEKANNLHLFIPPQSSHPPGLLSGMVHGMIFRIYQLCTDPEDQRLKTLQLLQHFRYRGWTNQQVKPLMRRAIRRATSGYEPKSQSLRKREMDRSIVLHLQYHPKNPKPHTLQQLWRDKILSPFTQRKLFQLRNYKFCIIEVDRMIIAHSRTRNLGNLLSYRDIKEDSGPPTSSFL